MANRFLKRNWVLTEESFNKLLEALDPNRRRAAEQYEHLRRSLIRYFEWRGSSYSERDADDTIDRVARKLNEGSIVEDFYTYALGVARNVALESLRGTRQEQAWFNYAPLLTDDPKVDEDADRRFDCFESCLAQLSTAKRELILAYYEGDQKTKIANRRRLATAVGMPISRLRIQAHRIREKLEACIKDCLS